MAIRRSYVALVPALLSLSLAACAGGPVSLGEDVNSDEEAAHRHANAPTAAAGAPDLALESFTLRSGAQSTHVTVGSEPSAVPFTMHLGDYLQIMIAPGDVKNIGTATSSAGPPLTLTAKKVGGGGEFSGGSQLNGNSTPVWSNTLAAGSSDIYGGTGVSFFSVYGPGTYQVQACVSDPLDTNTANNCSSWLNVTILPAAPVAPDLALQSFTLRTTTESLAVTVGSEPTDLPFTMHLGEYLQIMIAPGDVKNIGTAASSAGPPLRLSFKKAGINPWQASGSSQLNGNSTPVWSNILAAGSSDIYGGTGVSFISAYGPGTYGVQACVSDPLDTDTANNCSRWMNVNILP